MINETSLLNGTLGEYILTNRTIVLASGYGNCIWMLGSNISIITNISAYTFNWAGQWNLLTSYPAYSGVSQCCLPAFPVFMTSDSFTRTVNYTLTYNNTVNSTTSTNSTGTNSSNASNTTTGNSSSVCASYIPNGSYTMNTSMIGGSFFDNTSLLIAFSLSNGSILVQTQNCFWVLQKSGTSLVANCVVMGFSVVMYLVCGV